ncbi:outer membrane protein assembly factor BamB family protein [Candidatus Seribacter sulfatis]|jgi:outer membrane protein assembly factor BamB|uniref:outer membrane protein assembly factor BamB family protein n=1 Tax=Candidatus Seribacter sulfatis TaxID=3381756 RepID=UPI00389B06E4
MKLYLLYFVNLSLVALVSFGQNWNNWRGPNFNGSSDTTESLPEKFDNNTNVKWKYKLPGPSGGTPIINEQFVFISSIKILDKTSGSGELLAFCFNRESGELMWRNNAGSGYRPGEGDGFDYQLDSRSNYASPSPVTDGERVIFFFGNGDLVSYLMDGTEEWRRNIQKDYGDFCFQWTFSSTPTLFGNKLYLPVLQRDEQAHGRGNASAKSFILCMNPKNGKTIWKQKRPSVAQKESLESFGTIIPHNNQLLTAGGDVLTGHDPKSGKEIWRWGTWNPKHKEQWWRLVPSPVVGKGVILVCAPKKAPIFAIKTGLKGIHEGSDGLSWETKAEPTLTSDVPTPLFYDGKFYILSDLKKVLSRVNPQNGKIEWSKELPGKYKWRSSPTAGDGKVYIMNHNGEVVVISSQSGEILHLAKMGGTYDDNTRSSVSIGSKELFIRTNEILYCIQ